MARRILLATMGSLGDLHPYMGIGLRLAARGARVTIATTELYRDKIVAAGLGFHAVRPHFSVVDPQLIEWLMDPVKGPERVLRELMLPAVRDSYEDLLPAAREADALVGHPLAFGVPLAAEVLRLPWASTALAPLSLFSNLDPSLLGPSAWLRLARASGPTLHRAFLAVGQRATRGWTAPVARLREELGLGRGGHPLFAGQHSPHLVLALFSAVFAAPQRDWPPHTVQTGFAVYDREGLPEPGGAGASAGTLSGLPAEVEEFLRACEARRLPPIVFTLGSTAVVIPGDFFAASAAAARRLGRPALLVGARSADGGVAPAVAAAAGADGSILAAPYLPYSAIFPRAAVIVHQGGIGTVGQALAAGRPMLIVPFSHDQPDNAARLVRMGIARTVSRARYTADGAAAAVGALLDDAGAAARAAAAGARVRGEDGAGAAGAAIERTLFSDVS